MEKAVTNCADNYCEYRSQGKILFVDDDENILEAMRRGFGREYEVHVASSSSQALEALAAKGSFNVIISDVRMPQMDGIALLSRVRDLYPDTVRIILTGYANLQNALDAVNECQAFRLLSKPCSIEKLKQAVKEAMAQSLLIRSQVELAVLRKHKQAMEGIILGFSKLVETRDPYTAGHQRKVAALAEAIGMKLGFDLDRLIGLRLAALVHDIGKMYVPAEFLNKPGRLTDLEFGIIKQHPTVGHEILAPIEFAWPISRYVLEHHERLDGSGYPAGLSGENICLEARVIAVADTVDAMSSNRPYRPGRGLEKALAEIKNNRGILYDSDAADKCLVLFNEDGFNFDLR